MRSVIDVYNTALGRLGGNQFERVNTPEEEGTVATLCRTFFPHALDKALVHSEWGFARKRVVLARKHDELANPDYPFRYALPTDCVRPVSIDGQVQGGGTYGGSRWECDGYSYGGGYGCPYILDGQDILACIEPAVLTYVRRVSDPVSWPPLFADAVAYLLAAELATAYVNDAQRQQIFTEMAERKLGEAAAVELNSQRRKRTQSPWIWSR